MDKNKDKYTSSSLNTNNSFSLPDTNGHSFANGLTEYDQDEF